MRCGGVGFGSGSLSPDRAVCGVLLIGSHELTRCWGIRCCLGVGMGACHGIAPATVERERCVSELMHRGGVGFGSGSLSQDRAVCGVLLIGSHDSTRYWGIRCCLVVGMGACHGIAPAVVKRERCVSETRIVVESVAVVVGRP